MNGIHDMGGMQDMGPLQYEKGEPVFHAPWESRVLAMALATFAWRKWNLDAFRHTREVLPPEDYLRLSYYEQWFLGLRDLLVRRDLLTTAEIDSGVPASGSAKETPPLTADKVNPVALSTRIHAQRDLPVSPRFKVGEQVRARNINPVGHTRLPRYARGKVGTIHRDHGVFVFPDTRAHFLGDKPQHVYSVRFAARELWGAQASEKDCVYLDMWDDYLDAA
jgi:nitrile hydratase subunit beta